MFSFDRFSRNKLPWFAVALCLFAARGHSAFTRPLHADEGMVVSPDARASEAGLQMLKMGGNAVDAAVATTFAVSVAEPYSAGIGGGGFLLLHLEKSGELLTLDFRERAPQTATRDMYLTPEGTVDPQKSMDGYLSVAVPGTVAGMYEVHRKYGKLPWKKVVAPAIELADKGIVVDALWVRAVNWRKEVLTRFAASRAIFTKDGEPHRPGSRVRQKDLAQTLRRIANHPRDFYEGKIAKAIVDDMQKNGGLISREDLQSYKPTWRAPVCGTFRSHRVCSMPPPSSGGVHLVEILNLLEPYPLKSWGFNHPDTLHTMIESMRIAYADRATHLGDPEFVSVPVPSLISKKYADLRRPEMRMEKARSSAEVIAGTPEQLSGLHESKDTSHLTVVDADRNAVSLTFTVNYGFGSGVVVPGTGILLNDEMDDFSAAPGTPNAYGLVGGEANAIAPRKIPLSSMTPTIVTRDGKLRLAGGSPGGSTIITTSLQLVLNVVEHGMNAGDAVSAPRIHQQWQPEQTRFESWGMDPLTRSNLESRGHQLKEMGNGWGNANLIVVTDDGRLEGAADPRGSGAPAGHGL